MKNSYSVANQDCTGIFSNRKQTFQWLTGSNFGSSSHRKCITGQKGTNPSFIDSGDSRVVYNDKKIIKGIIIKFLQCIALQTGDFLTGGRFGQP